MRLKECIWKGYTRREWGFSNVVVRVLVTSHEPTRREEGGLRLVGLFWVIPDFCLRLLMLTMGRDTYSCS